MKKRLLITLLVAFLAAAATGPSGAQQARADSHPTLNLAAELTMLSALPEPADDPLLDANGAVVLDSFGKPVSDPSEGFHKVIPNNFDPGNTHLVQSTWLDGTGCPTDAFTATPNADFTAWSGSTAPYTDAACPHTAADLKDKHNEGLLLVKTGPTVQNFASATAELKKVRGMTLTELGYDIRKIGPTTADARGSHCGFGAPRFDIEAQDGTFYFLGCGSPASAPPFGMQTSSGMGWTRMRWSSGGQVFAFCINPDSVMSSVSCPSNFALVPVNGPVKRITIVFDEGQDGSATPDQFGAAFLDNIDVNGTLVGRGPAGPGMAEDKSKDDDDDD